VSAQRYDILIIGAGPAGMAAAIEARRHGMSVLVVDENATPGGHYYSNVGVSKLAQRQLFGADHTAAVALIEGFVGSGALYWPNTFVWQVSAGMGSDHQAMLTQRGVKGGTSSVQAGAVLLATGAQERPYPLRGWTMPGVMNVGAAQTLMKSSGLAPTSEAVLVGSGPLLYLFAHQLLKAGRKVQALLETTPRNALMKALPRLPQAMLGIDYLTRGAWMMLALKRARIPHIQGVDNVEILGSSCAEGVRFTKMGVHHTLKTRLVLLHQGVIPGTNLSRSLNCLHEWDVKQACWRPRVDGAGIGGAALARYSGIRAALDIAYTTGCIDEAARQSAAWPTRLASLRLLALRPFLDALYAPHMDVRQPADDVIVCRCEEVTAGEIRRIAQMGCTGPNQLKAFSRCGMGLCQGRCCGPIVGELLAHTQQRSPSEIGYFRIRAPVKPVTLAEIAQAADSHTKVMRGDFPS
jgi:thioredoxin reductase/bacterioferritin-associated ferredoxin